MPDVGYWILHFYLSVACSTLQGGMNRCPPGCFEKSLALLFQPGIFIFGEHIFYLVTDICRVIV
ncbi:MAG: hypothetical protein BWY65_02196 [Firmicutes bacterium ADurb.Bin373]|nr:MAG: hypothetical protein BWY65_02196 [Firmicutes bacterium ADurb.Bin373]